MPAGRPVTVWDLPTRLFHWVLVLCLAGSWWSAETGRMDLHMWLGQGVLALVVFRLLWGLGGSETARFSAFVRGPQAVWEHLRSLTRPGPLPPEPWHNPLGALAVVALLVTVAVQADTGLFTSDGILTEGPLAATVDGDTGKLLRRIHLAAFDLLLILAGLHVAAILGYAIVKRRNLVTPMLTGRMALPMDAPAPRIVSPLWALPVAAVAAALVWALVAWP